MVFDAKMGDHNFEIEVFELYVLQIKRFRRSGKLIENGSPNGTKKGSKFKPLVKGLFLRFWWILSSLIFWCFFRQKAGQPIKQMRFRRSKIEIPDQIIILGGPLSSGSSHFGWFYILIFDNASVGGFRRICGFYFGARRILTASPN